MNNIKVVILGVNGGFGHFFTRVFENNNTHITGIDLAEQANTNLSIHSYISTDLLNPSREATESIVECDYLLLCLPEEIACSFLKKVIHNLQLKTVVIDTLSVKSDVEAIVKEYPTTVLSINPMFGPDLDPKGKNMAVVEFNQNEKSNTFLKMMEGLGIHILSLSAEEHDRITALTQVITHMNIVAFGMAVNDSSLDSDKVYQLGTPPFLTLSSLFGRIRSNDPNLYWSIQKENPYAGEARKLMLEKLTALNHCIETNDQKGFAKFIQSDKNITKKILDKLNLLCKKIFRIDFI